MDVSVYSAMLGFQCRKWFLLPRQSFIHDVSSADPLGLRALFVRTLQQRNSLAPLFEKCVTAHQNHTEFISVSSVVAERRGWSRVALR